MLELAVVLELAPKKYSFLEIKKRQLMINWNSYTNDPLDNNIKLKIYDYLTKLQAIYKGSLLEYFGNVASKKNVLHIGCVEHDELYMNLETWKHKIINDCSLTCIGLDINKIGIEKMNARGYPAICMDATSDNYLDQKFDIIIVGDVIEHLTNIGGLIKFCKNNLEDNGSIIISTPNPFYLGSVFAAWFKGPMIANFEHTCWLSESNILEICRRHDLSLVNIIYPTGKSTKNKIIFMIKKISFKLKSFFAFTCVVYEIKKS